ncbi:MAG TPA: hypothetical protein VFI98_11735 [Pseudolabrys sp.]|jgi:hypothetical protein|nr:hypothetical protein [Pseudolabrys sp.]
MSRLTQVFASAALVLCVIAFAPGSAEARWHGGWHGGWHRGWGGFGWGPAFGFGWGYPYAYYPGPYYYAAPYYARPACGWSRARVWRNGHWALRRAWRCW